MKNIFLIGDSIRFGSTNSPGYGRYVQELLAPNVKVFAPNENCRFAQYTLRYLREWANEIDAKAIDTVYWNNGLWDVLHLDGDEALTPCDVYAALLKRIAYHIRKHFPHARIIFALSTPVEEKLGNPDFMRYNAEIEHYNRVAAEALRPLGIEIHDLYAVASQLTVAERADWVHYNEAGARFLAQAVVQKLQEKE